MDVFQSNGRIRYIEPTMVNDNGDGVSYQAPLEDYCIGIDLTMSYTEKNACGRGKERGQTKEWKNHTSFFGGTDGKLTTNYINMDMATPWENTTEGLGIREISIDYNEYLYPKVAITFVDIRGMSFIQPLERKENYGEGTSSFYKMLYSMPSPTFKLKVKGFYGGTVTYNLVLSESRLSFDGSNGDFIIEAKFIGTMYGVYSDIPLSLILSSPYIGGVGSNYWQSQLTNGAFVFKMGDNKTPMMTIPELRLKIAQASSRLPDVKAIEGYDNVVNDREIVPNIAMLENILVNYPFESDGREDDWIRLDNYTFTFYGDGRKSKKSLLKRVKEINEKVREYNKRNIHKIPESRLLKAIEADPNILMEIKVERRDWRGTVKIINGREEINEYIKAHINDQKIKNNTWGFTVIAVPTKPLKEDLKFLETIKESLVSNYEKKEERNKEFLKQRNIALCNAIGMYPTVRNVFNLLFAHVDTFMEVFYHYLDRISEEEASKRHFSHFGISSIEMTDSLTDQLPPFPNVYKEITRDDGTIVMEEIWVGDLVNSQDLPEVEFVMSLMAALENYNQASTFVQMEIDDDNENLDVNIDDRDEDMEVGFVSRATLLSLYQMLKRIYDKWICSGERDKWKLEDKTFKLGEIDTYSKSDFSNFLFIDSFYHNIGDRFIINPTKFSNILGGYVPSGYAEAVNANKNLYSLLSFIAQDNGANLMAFPAFFGGGTEEGVKKMFTPQSFLENELDDRSTYIFIYTYEPSHTLELNDDYTNDGFNLTDLDGELSTTLPSSLLDIEDSQYICAFGVNYAKQNQAIFHNLVLNMDNPNVTEAALMGSMQIASIQGEGPRESAIYGQDLFKVYSNYMYEVSMDMMGNAQIMPLMYFQLNGIPMWRGTYMIKSVSHRIVPGNMTTHFSGYRVNQNALPLTDGLIMYDSK